MKNPQLITVIALSMLSWQSRNSSPPYSYQGVHSYRDINYLDLAGVDEMREEELDQYPYFQLQDVDRNERKLTFCYAKNSQYSRSFTRKDNYWYNFASYYSEGERPFQVCRFTYIYSDQIVRLKYGRYVESKEEEHDSVETDSAKLPLFFDSNAFILYDIVIEQNNKRYTYQYKDPAHDQEIKIEPSPDLAKKVNKLRYLKLFEETFEVKDDVIRWERKVLKPKDFAPDDITCKKRTDKWGYTHNIFWVSVYQMGEEVDCL